MSFVFEIPKRNKDLIEDPNCSNYFVRQVYEINEISKYLRCKFIIFIFEIFAKLNEIPIKKVIKN